MRNFNARLGALPEALLGGYPKGESFGTRVGYRLPEGRHAFADYYANAVDVPGPGTETLEALSKRTWALSNGPDPLYIAPLFTSRLMMDGLASDVN